MNKNIFWDYVNSAVQQFPGFSVKVAIQRKNWIIDQLVKHSDEDIVVFNAIWDAYQYMGKHKHISSIAQQISPHFNDDIYYEEFPNWLILQGMDFFRSVYEKPIRLALALQQEKVEISLWVAIAREAYQKKVNDPEAELPDNGQGDYDLENDAYLTAKTRYGRHTRTVKKIERLVWKFMWIHKDEASERLPELMKEIGQLLDKKKKRS